VVNIKRRRCNARGLNDKFALRQFDKIGLTKFGWPIFFRRLRVNFYTG